MILIQLEPVSPAPGLVISAGNSVVRGLSLTGGYSVTNPNEPAGGAIVLSKAGGNVIEGNFIGIAPDGSGETSNGTPNGVLVNCSDNLVGGTTPAARNVVGGNLTGITLTDVAHRTTIAGNYLGTDPSGSRAIGNQYGVYATGILENTVLGGTAAGAGNLISGNTVYGVS